MSLEAISAKAFRWTDNAEKKKLKIYLPIVGILNNNSSQWLKRINYWLHIPTCVCIGIYVLLG